MMKQPWHQAMRDSEERTSVTPGWQPTPVVCIERPVVYASDCRPCDMCGEPICPVCQIHYADCACPGPHSDHE